MILTLEIISPHAGSLGTAARQSFGPDGGTIGRARTSDWVLPNGKVSNRHALITFARGTFYIEDTSTNGVFLNQSKERLVRGRPRALRSGDRLTIDEYDIRVTVSGAARTGGDAGMGQLLGADEDPFGADLLGSASPSEPLGAAEAGAAGEVDPLKLLGGAAPKVPRKVPTARALDADSPLAGHYRPPAVLTPPPARAPRNEAPVPLIPEDYDPLASDSGAFSPPTPPSMPPPRPATPRPGTPPPALPAVDADPFAFDDETNALGSLLSPAPAAPPPTPVPSEPGSMAPPPAAPLPVSAPPPVATPRPDRDAAIASPSVAVPLPSAPAPAEAPVGAAANAGLAAMLAGAGLEDVEVSDELARDFGRILRVVVAGVMDVLRARQQIKDEFRMRMTQFRPADNNPLKFSANVEDALHNLLVKRNAAYLPAVEAFDDAFEDMREHQIAMLAGIRVAFDTMLAQFDPARLQGQFDRQLKKGGLLAVPAKMRYWDLYRERSEALLADPEDTFRKLFGEEFSRAYEEQLSRIKADRRGPPKPMPR